MPNLDYTTAIHYCAHPKKLEKTLSVHRTVKYVIIFLAVVGIGCIIINL